MDQDWAGNDGIKQQQQQQEDQLITNNNISIVACAGKMLGHRMKKMMDRMMDDLP